MGFSEFLGNERIVAALRGALRSERVPHALLFSGPRGLGKFTLARMFAQAANCERLKDDFCGECETCKRIALLADPEKLIEQGLAERGESADAATVERVPLDSPNASGRLGAGSRSRPSERVPWRGPCCASASFAPFSVPHIFSPWAPPRLHSGWCGNHALERRQCVPQNPGGTARLGHTHFDRAVAVRAAPHYRFSMPAISIRAALPARRRKYSQRKNAKKSAGTKTGGAARRRQSRPGHRNGRG